MNWDLVLKILEYASGPIVGAVIGLFTNYLAIKMLFRPYYPKKIGKLTLPFTPGIIPKRKKDIAKAVGKAVGEELFTNEDISKMLCSPEVEEKLISTVKEALNEQTSHSINEIVTAFAGDDTTEQFKETLSNMLAEKIVSAAGKMEIDEIIAEKGKEAILEKKSSMGILGLFVTNNLINSMLGEVKNKVSAFLVEDGVETALPAIRKEVAVIVDTPLNEQFDFSSFNEEKVKDIVHSIYDSAVKKTIACATENLDISGVVEEKINSMDIKEVEALCMKVMKKELGAIVYLGGILGFLMGIINIFL